MDNLNSTKNLYPVNNAGLVLLSVYLPALFEKLHFVSTEKVIIPEKSAHAIHCLQYMVTGIEQAEESQPSLNKVLCGVAITDYFTDNDELTSEEINTLDSLIEAAISHWPAIGHSSLEGFRGNWLIREGQLVEFAEKWELKVAKRAYDLLISKAPFSFSIIKYPWMDKPIYVSWAY